MSFDAISIDGKLPYITNGVAISTMLANTSALGENGDGRWTAWKKFWKHQG